MRQGDSPGTMQYTFADGRDGARMMNVGSEIGARIDSRENPLRLGRKLAESQSDAVGRRARNGYQILAHRLDVDRRTDGHAMPTARMATRGSHHPAATESGSGLPQRGKAGRIPAVVIGEEERGRWVGQGGLPAFTRGFRGIGSRGRWSIRCSRRDRSDSTPNCLFTNIPAIVKIRPSEHFIVCTSGSLDPASRGRRP